MNACSTARPQRTAKPFAQFFVSESGIKQQALVQDYALVKINTLPKVYQQYQMKQLISQENLLWPPVLPSYQTPEFPKIDLETYFNSPKLETQSLLYFRSNHLEYLENLQMTESISPELQQQRQSSLIMANKVINQFLTTYPELASEFEVAAGYAVLDITSFNVLLYVGGWGDGVLFDNINHKAVYIDYLRNGTGLGLGYIADYEIFIFKSHEAIEQFIGADAGADIGISGTIGLWTKYYSLNPTINSYHIYQSGGNLQYNWGGTYFWESPKLN